MSIKVFVPSVSSNLEVRAKQECPFQTKKRQQKICLGLDGKKIPYELLDISQSDEIKASMREIAGASTLPPQICNGDVYCGDFDAFDQAVENETLEEFLKLYKERKPEV